jgi:HEAT repeat protein
MKMGLLVKSTAIKNQARQLNWLGRGMSGMRRWEDAHPGLRKAEFMPSVGAGILAYFDHFAPLLLSSGEAGYLAGGLLLANILFRAAGFRARRIDYEGKMDEINGLPRKKQLKYCWVILRDERAQDRSRIAAARIMGKLGAVEYFSRLESMLVWNRDPSGEVAGAVLVAVVNILGKLSLGNWKQRERGEVFAEKCIGHQGKGNERWRRLLVEHKDKSPKIESLAGEWLEKALERALWYNRFDVAKEVIEEMGKVGGPEVISALEKAFRRVVASDGFEVGLDYSNVAETIMGTLGEIGPKAISILGRVLLKAGQVEKSKMWHYEDVRIAAAEALGKVGSEAIPVLDKALMKEAVERWDDIGVRWNEILNLREAAITPQAWCYGAVRNAAARARLRINEFRDESEENRVKAFVHAADGDWDKAEALGPAAIPALEKEAEEAWWYRNGDTVISAVRSLGRIRDISALPLLEKLLDEVLASKALVPADRNMAKAMIGALGEIGSTSSIPGLEKAQEHGDAEVRISATGILGGMGAPSVAVLEKALEEALASNRYNEAKGIIRALGKIGSAAVPVLEKALKHRDGETGKAAAEARLGINEFRDEFEENRVRAYIHVVDGDWDKAVALGPAARPALEKELEHWQPRDKDTIAIRAAVWALGEIGDPAAIPALAKTLEKALASDYCDVAKVIIGVLGKIGSALSIPALERAREYRDASVRETAAKVLSRIDESTSKAERDQIRARFYVGGKDWDKAAALGPAAVPELGEALEEALGFNRYNEAIEIIEALGKIGSSRAIPALTQAKNHRNNPVKNAAKRVLRSFKKR